MVAFSSGLSESAEWNGWREVGDVRGASSVRIPRKAWAEITTQSFHCVGSFVGWQPRPAVLPADVCINSMETSALLPIVDRAVVRCRAHWAHREQDEMPSGEMPVANWIIFKLWYRKIQLCLLSTRSVQRPDV